MSINTFIKHLAHVGIFTLVTTTFTAYSIAEELSADEIMQKVNAREDGQYVTRNSIITLTDRRGIVRKEETISYRKYFEGEKRTILFYTEPSSVRGTGFLTYDYQDPNVDDDQWLYLPALRKVRRISASNRGDYFLGTDLSYEEIKKENKIELNDYSFKYLGESTVDGKKVYLVESTPINDDIKKEVGYSKIVSNIDPDIWISRKTEFWDVSGNPLKTITNTSIEKIDGLWTVSDLYVVNHKTNHRTQIQFKDTDYSTPFDDDIFTQQFLRRGLR